MQLRLIPAFTSGLCKCQRFRERRETCLWLTPHTMCVGEECKKIGLKYHCACGTIGYQALSNLLDPFLCLSLVRSYPTAQKRTERYPERKSLLCGEAHGGFGTLLSNPPFAAVLME